MLIPAPLLTAGSSFFLFCVVHVLVWRAMRRKGVLLLALLAIASYCAVLLALLSWNISPAPWYSLPIFGLAVLAYLHVYVGTYRSVSVRILEETMRSGDRISPEGLDAVYPKRWMLTSRLDILVTHRWIFVDEAHRYSLTRKGSFFAFLIARLRAVYGIHRAG